MTDCKIIELGADLGDDRSLSSNAQITFRYKIPVIGRVNNPYDRETIGIATNPFIEDGWIVASIEITNGMKVDAYRYFPEFKNDQWQSFDMMPPHLSMYSGELVALYAAPSPR